MSGPAFAIGSRTPATVHTRWGTTTHARRVHVVRDGSFNWRWTPARPCLQVNWICGNSGGTDVSPVILLPHPFVDGKQLCVVCAERAVRAA